MNSRKIDISMSSSLLTSTIVQMRYIIEDLEQEKLRDELIIFIGGLPVTKEFSKEIGADYYISKQFSKSKYR